MRTATRTPAAAPASTATSAAAAALTSSPSTSAYTPARSGHIGGGGNTAHVTDGATRERDDNTGWPATGDESSRSAGYSHQTLHAAVASGWNRGVATSHASLAQQQRAPAASSTQQGAASVSSTPTPPPPPPPPPPPLPPHSQHPLLPTPTPISSAAGNGVTDGRVANTDGGRRGRIRHPTTTITTTMTTPTSTGAAADWSHGRERRAAVDVPRLTPPQPSHSPHSQHRQQQQQQHQRQRQQYRQQQQQQPLSQGAPGFLLPLGPGASYVGSPSGLLPMQPSFSHASGSRSGGCGGGGGGSGGGSGGPALHPGMEIPMHDHLPSHVAFQQHMQDSSRKLLALFLESNDEMQCRFAVKNDDKEANQRLASVQRLGYVEYKARYCKKRGQQTGYGYFHVAFRPLNTVIYPFQRLRNEWTQHQRQPEEDAVLYQHQVHVENLERVLITVRLYQSFRGHYPTKSYHFEDSEVYQNLYVKEWQDATCMVRNRIPGVALETDPDGEFIQYVVHDAKTLEDLHGPSGLKFPCPIPARPERLNDVGMLRMQVTVKFMVKDARDSPDARFIKQGEELNAWIRLKIVQQLSGRKKRFTRMLRPPSEAWSMPPRPEVRPVEMDGGRIIQHVIGKEALVGTRALALLEDIAQNIAGNMLSDDTEVPSTTCMHEACSTGNMGVLLMLLQYRSTLVHVVDHNGNTPLHVAATAGQISVATLLYEAGARLDAVNKMGHTPKAVAEHKGSQATVATLAKFEERDGSGCSLFRAAAIGSGLQVIKLLKSHTNPNDINVHGHTALFLAIDHNQPWTVHILVRRGASTRIYNKQGRMAIHQAAWRGDPETLVILLHEDPHSIDLPSQSGSTPLHIAAERGHVLCVQILISCGADLTLRDARGHTALDIASARKNGDVQLLLLKRGNHRKEDTKGLLSRCREGGSLHIAAKKGDLALTCKLLAAGARISQRDADGNTALHLAARHGRFLVVDELLAQSQQRDDPHEKSVPQMTIVDGRDPLHLACCKDSISSAIVLVSRKLCNVRARTVSGNTALHTAAENGQMFVASFLRLSGINPNIRNMSGKTPLQLALEHNNVATASVLRFTDAQLQELSQHLKSPPFAGKHHVTASPGRHPQHQPPLPGTNTTGAGGQSQDFIHLDALGQILSRLWHCTLDACRVLRTFRLEEASQRAEQAQTSAATPGSAPYL